MAVGLSAVKASALIFYRPHVLVMEKSVLAYFNMRRLLVEA